MTDYDDYQADRAPAWLGAYWGPLLMRVFGLMKQAVVEAATEAVLARFPEYAPEDALEYMLEMRGLDPPFGEDSDTVRKRIKRAFTTAMLRGTPLGLETALRHAGYVNFTIQERVAKWWEFDLVLLPPFPWSGSHADGAWDDPGVWDDGGAWAHDIPDDHLARLRALIKKWKGTHERCRNIIIVFSGTTWDDPANGTWDSNPGRTWSGLAAYVMP